MSFTSTLNSSSNCSSNKFVYHLSQMEVSMPTGSLCAERSAIASALSSDFLLRYNGS